MSRIGKRTFVFDNMPRIIGNYCIVGPKEGKGNFAQFFDEINEDDLFGESSYEKAESRMMEIAIRKSIQNANLQIDDVDVLCAGDLMNQITSSSFAARTLGVPYAGMFGACSTMAESLLIGASLVDGGFVRNAVCSTGSHFSSAEKQFRYPLELGTQRPPTSQWTVTGAGSTVLALNDTGIAITSGTIGKVIDWGITDANNMGSAMAPAAADTIIQHFLDTGREPSYYDLILTGDLGKLGSEVLMDLLEYRGYKLGSNYNDCGQMIYGNTQKTFMGGSGCGCGATILNGYVLKRLISKKLKNVLFVATGALMSTTLAQQGESIPSIAHGVVLKGDF